MQAIKDAVDSYFRLGWTVLPCDEDKKSTEGRINWSPYQTKKPTPEEWRQWIEKKVFGLAVLTGAPSGFVVVDVDTEEIPLGLESTIVARTQSGGWHFYYKYDLSCAWRNTVKVDGSPIDFRGNGGLVMVPPTKIKGNPYQWVKPPTQEALDSLPELPDNVRKWLKVKTTPVIYKSPSDKSYPGYPEGQRNSKLWDHACSLANYFYKSPNAESVLSLTLHAANAKNSPPIESEIVEAMVPRAIDFVRGSPPPSGREIASKTTTVNDFSEYCEEEVNKLMAIRREEMPLGLSDWDRSFKWPAGFYAIAGASGSGKGWWAFWLARKFFEKHGRRTAFFSLEMNQSLVYDRLYQAWSDLTEDQYLVSTKEQIEPAKKLLRQNAILVYPFGELDSAQRTPENFELQVDRQYQLGYRIFMLDHLHEIDGAGSMDTNQRLVEVWSKKFADISKKYPDCWVIIFVQVNSASEGKKFLTKKDIYGSKVITQKADVIMSIVRQLKFNSDGEPIRETNPKLLIHIDKNRLSSHQGFSIRMVFLDTGNYTTETEFNNRPPMHWEEVSTIFDRSNNV